MNFNDWVIFKTIYEEKTLNKAAKKLGYTQSNITARLQLLENEFDTVFFVRNYSGIKATPNGEQFYSFVLKTLYQLKTLKSSFSEHVPTLLTSELLFSYLVIESELFSINSTQITCKKTCNLVSELNENHYDFVISFNELASTDYQLVEKDQLTVCFLTSRQSKKTALPILINSDTSCPLRKLTIELAQKTNQLLEVDSLENILQLVSKGEAIALLPSYLQKNEYVQLDNRLFQIAYYSYRYNVY